MAFPLVSCVLLSPRLLFSLLFLLLPSAISSQQHPRAPHGLAYQSPVSLPPSAFEFFHPRALEPAAAGSAPAPLPPSTLYPAATTSKARADAVVVTAGAVPEPRSRRKGSLGTVGGVAALAVGMVAAALATVAASYVVVRRRGNVERTKTTVQSDA